MTALHPLLPPSVHAFGSTVPDGAVLAGERYRARTLSGEYLWLGDGPPSAEVLERGVAALAAVPLAGAVGPARGRAGRFTNRARPLKVASLRPRLVVPVPDGLLASLREVEELAAGLLVRRVHAERSGVDLSGPSVDPAALGAALRRHGFRLLLLGS